VIPINSFRKSGCSEVLGVGIVLPHVQDEILHVLTFARANNGRHLYYLRPCSEDNSDSNHLQGFFSKAFFLRSVLIKLSESLKRKVCLYLTL